MRVGERIVAQVRRRRPRGRQHAIGVRQRQIRVAEAQHIHRLAAADRRGPVAGNLHLRVGERIVAQVRRRRPRGRQHAIGVRQRQGHVAEARHIHRLAAADGHHAFARNIHAGIGEGEIAEMRGRRSMRGDLSVVVGQGQIHAAEAGYVDGAGRCEGHLAAAVQGHCALAAGKGSDLHRRLAAGGRLPRIALQAHVHLAQSRKVDLGLPRQGEIALGIHPDLRVLEGHSPQLHRVLPLGAELAVADLQGHLRAPERSQRNSRGGRAFDLRCLGGKHDPHFREGIGPQPDRRRAGCRQARGRDQQLRGHLLAVHVEVPPGLQPFGSELPVPGRFAHARDRHAALPRAGDQAVLLQDKLQVEFSNPTHLERRRAASFVPVLHGARAANFKRPETHGRFTFRPWRRRRGFPAGGNSGPSRTQTQPRHREPTPACIHTTPLP